MASCGWGTGTRRGGIVDSSRRRHTRFDCDWSSDVCSSDLGANPVQEISGTSASANLLTAGVDQYFQRTDSAGARNFLTDALGSTLALADSTGTVQTSYTFEPFGNTSVTGSSTTNSFAYTGRELDGTGLYFYRARYYHPQLQRFISEDPIRSEERRVGKE